MEGRWTIHDLRLREEWNARVSGPYICTPIPLVPCDDAAIERLAQYLYDSDDERVRVERPDGEVVSDWLREPDGYKGLFRDKAREAVRVLAMETYS